ncbi:phosphoenolpyruvate carboxylase, partial [Klebsiella pneumoniae]|uniref:phosphoenolpyruvate carboxylase n=1 Tax=Klebsiella pneumoniae TaxID=573 RepID=UPI002381677A
ILDRVETIRKLSKSSRAGNEANRQELLTTLQNLSNDELLPVAPLFETLDDLNNANDVMTQLLNIDWYRGFIQGKQMVMIG